ncbi:hypothetical protein LCGC14_2350760 [marine sediment metagenome]|uniref:Uncharacterized protein n=1 Tax=marine sediment metagenome TaxID=412755 RepID=A0A0F9ELZ7_9ZZZZ
MSEHGTRIHVRALTWSLIACCDYGLVHAVFAEPDEDGVTLTFRRDEYFTKEERARTPQRCVERR